MKFIYFSILSALFVAFAFAMPLRADEISAADSAYSAEQYPEAISIYDSIASRQGVSSELLFNLGNAYSKSGDYGHALVYYLRALRIDPSNKKAEANVKYIESKVYDANKAELKGKKLSLDPDASTFFSSVRKFICANHLSDTWAVWSLVCFLLAVAGVALYIFTQGVIWRKIGFFSSFIFIGFTAVLLVFSFMAASYQTHDGVVVGTKVKLMSEPSGVSKEHAVALNRGTRLNVLDVFPAPPDHPQWYKVRLNSDFVGWLSSDDFMPVEEK